MTKTITVEGDLAAVDTAYNLTTQGSVTAPTLLVPMGASKVDRIVAVCTPDGLAAGSAVYFIRLSGPAILGGAQTIFISSSALDAVQSGSDQAPLTTMPIVIEDVDIAVRAGDSLTIQAEMAGTDNGTAYACVTLVFA